MKPEELHRDHIGALVAGNLEAAASIRRQFSASDRTFAVEYLRSTTAICLEYRFGPGAGLGAGPVDHDELAAFMTEVRETTRGTEPPPDYLAIEAVVRSLYGEPHLLEPLTDHQRSQALYSVLLLQTNRFPWLAANLHHAFDRAKHLMTTWLLGAPTA
jgi:hypothetical protein